MGVPGSMGPCRQASAYRTDTAAGSAMTSAQEIGLLQRMTCISAFSDVCCHVVAPRSLFSTSLEYIQSSAVTTSFSSPSSSMPGINEKSIISPPSYSGEKDCPPYSSTDSRRSNELWSHAEDRTLTEAIEHYRHKQQQLRAYRAFEDSDMWESRAQSQLKELSNVRSTLE